MAFERSFDSIVARLEAQIVQDREQEALHAQHEAFHRERRTHFAAELEKLTAILEAFRTAADTALDLARREALPPSPPSPDIGRRKPSLTKMVARIVEVKRLGDVFGTAAVTQEINRHYGERLRRPVKPKLVSIVLRRLAAGGRLRTVQPGRPHHEALYGRVEGG